MELRHLRYFVAVVEEGSFNRYKGWLATFLVAVAVASSAFHLYAAKEIVRTDLLREICRADQSRSPETAEIVVSYP